MLACARMGRGLRVLHAAGPAQQAQCRRWLSSTELRQRLRVRKKEMPNGRKAVGWIAFTIFCGAMVVPGVQYYVGLQRQERDRLLALNEGAESDEVGETVEYSNWSKTHTVQTKRLLVPETIEELEAIVDDAHETGKHIRVVGSACSPNGIALSEEAMLSMALLDKIVKIDTAASTVTVQAGCTVGQVVEALRPHGLTLENLASINLQQIGGFVQAGAHGTGATIPPVDEQVLSFKLVTPRLGTLDVNKTDKKELFDMARVAIGLLGVVSEVTLQCVRAHRLKEQWEVMTREEVKANHIERLRSNRHVKYLWYPYVDKVVVVTANKTSDALRDFASVPPPERGLAPLRALLAKVDGGVTREEMAALSLEGLRDRILAAKPFDLLTVMQLNEAEVECRRRYAGTRVANSDTTMAFECGGEQHVNESALTTGTLQKYTGADMECMDLLLQTVEEDAQIPAPGPIEQRWSAASSSVMSTAPQFPSGSLDVKTPSDQTERLLYTWIGIIMYIPYDDPERRGLIARRFSEYKKVVHDKVLRRYAPREHWAKLEEPQNQDAIRKIRKYMDARYPIEAFNRVRRLVDPKGVLSSPYTDKLFDST